MKIIMVPQQEDNLNRSKTEGELKIYSPANGEFIASVYQASEDK